MTTSSEVSSITRVTVDSCVLEFGAQFRGASDRLLVLVATGALTILSGVQNWEGKPKAESLEVLKERLYQKAAVEGNKRSNAYRWVSIAHRWAIAVSKGDKAFRETLKAAESVTAAASLMVASAKADGIRTLDQLEAAVAKPKAPATTVTIPVVDRVIKTLEKSLGEGELSKGDLEKLATWVTGQLALQGEVGKAVDQKAA